MKEELNNKVGNLIKKLRLERNMTLKDLGNKADLSITYISFVERGLSSVSFTSLQKIADALEVEQDVFSSFIDVDNKLSDIKRSYESSQIRLRGSYTIYQSLVGTTPKEGRVMDPTLVTILPGEEPKNVIPYSHKGEEFGYVLEGVLTFLVEGRSFELMPGDSFHISSLIPHNWANFTQQVVKLICVATDKVF